VPPPWCSRGAIPRTGLALPCDESSPSCSRTPRTRTPGPVTFTATAAYSHNGPSRCQHRASGSVAFSLSCGTPHSSATKGRSRSGGSTSDDTARRLTQHHPGWVRPPEAAQGGPPAGKGPVPPRGPNASAPRLPVRPRRAPEGGPRSSPSCAVSRWQRRQRSPVAVSPCRAGTEERGELLGRPLHRPRHRPAARHGRRWLRRHKPHQLTPGRAVTELRGLRSLLTRSHSPTRSAAWPSRCRWRARRRAKRRQHPIRVSSCCRAERPADVPGARAWSGGTATGEPTTGRRPTHVSAQVAPSA
jgi:hypothetical protein